MIQEAINQHLVAPDGLEVLFLGTGTSAGVPMIGCDCSVCQSEHPRNKRDRSSCMIRYPRPPRKFSPQNNPQLRLPVEIDQETDETSLPVQFVIDTTPEFRKQMLRHHVKAIDGVMITHTHADHIFGLDDLRRFNAVMEQPIEIFVEEHAANQLKRIFVYIFDPKNNINQSWVPQLMLHQLEPNETFEMEGANWTALRMMHGRLPILGYRVDWQSPQSAGTGNKQSIAYCTDVSNIPPETYPLMYDLDILVLDALRYKHHPTHLTVDQALTIIDELKPKQAYLTHMSHEIDYEKLNPQLPEGVELAYDGLLAKV